MSYPSGNPPNSMGSHPASPDGAIRMSDDPLQLYADLGVRPVINALGARTVLGGSEPHPEVVQLMQLAGRYYVDMDELFIRSGEAIADMIGAPATLVTPGCAAALVLGTAACLTGDDPQKMAQLPDLRGLKDQVIIQRPQRYKYDRVVRMTGVEIVPVGSDTRATEEDVEAAISERTAAVLYPEIDAPGSYLSVEDVVRIAHRHGLPVIVDSAYRVYPLDGLHRYAEMGADLFGYGAKYFGAPNSTGLLCGREDLIRSARLHSFAGFEKHDLLGLGRPFKVDRQEVFGVLAALRRWLSMDHDERFEAARKRAENLVRHLGPLTAVQIEQQASTVEVRCAEKRARSVADIAQALRDGHPSIWLDVRPHALHLDMLQVHDGDEALIASRLIEELSK